MRWRRQVLRLVDSVAGHPVCLQRSLQKHLPDSSDKTSWRNYCPELVVRLIFVSPVGQHDELGPSTAKRSQKVKTKTSWNLLFKKMKSS